LRSRGAGQEGFVDVSFPRIRYLRASREGIRDFTDSLFSSSIPLVRPETDGALVPNVSYATYLQAIETFLRIHRTELDQALREKGGASLADATSLDIIAEKHGSDYHPARVVAHLPHGTEQFVVNVALTDRGRDRIERDFELLQTLRQRCARDFIPRAYCCSDVSSALVSEPAQPATMFLGEWFAGYHEFHLSAGLDGTEQGMILWDLDHGYREPDREAQRVIYRKASMILSYYYDTKEYSEIYPWHHAAGDFIASLDGSEPSVRLITVRQYAPRIEFPPDQVDDRLIAATVFLAGLTIRMRLDRLDGVGEMSWAGDECVGATLEGAFDGLNAQIEEDRCDEAFVDDLAAFLKNLGPEDLADLFLNVVGSYADDAPDRALIAEQLPMHVVEVYGALQAIRLC
jgi:hypothetical protein